MTPACAPCPAPPDLKAGEVHVWTLRLRDLSPPDDTTLDDAERARAGRFHFDRDRHRFIHCRAFMRRILAHYLGCAPVDVPLATGGHGKPTLAMAAPLAFNLTHCASAALLAVTKEHNVGIDAEDYTTLDDLPGMIRLIFTPEEAASVLALPETGRQLPFLRGWTRKEAVLKLSGEGLTIPPDRIRVPFHGAGRWRGSIPAGLAGQDAAFDLVDISTDTLVAALAVTAGDHTPVVRRFECDPAR